jgi:serine/threonine-protein kinase
MVGQLLGSYLLVQKLGEGGMGAVYEAVHQQLGRRVAIKILHKEFSARPEIAQRFFNEARAVNIVQHPGIVGIFDYGQLPDGVTYLVMEYLAGESLAARLLRYGGRLGLEGLPLFRQIASALVAAHEKSIVHRDLKPGNIMIVPDAETLGGERAKILDFGVAKVAVENLGPGADQLRTRSGVIMGTPMYMAPEQCRGAAGVNDRADVYSLGIMIYQMLVGRPPFIADGMAEVMAMHLHSPPPPLSQFDPSLPAPLTQLVQRMLVKAPAARPAMKEVVQELELLGVKGTQPLSAYVPRRPTGDPGEVLSIEAQLPTVTTGVAMPGPSGSPGSIEGVAVRPPTLPPSRARVLVPAVIAALLTAGVITAVYEWRRVPPAEPAPVQPAAPARVSWEVMSVPAGAQVVREADGALLGQTPWRADEARGTGEVKLMLRLKGYKDQPVVLPRGKDMTVQTVLEPEPPPQEARPVLLPERKDEVKPAPDPQGGAREKEKRPAENRRPKEQNHDDDNFQLAPLR